MLQRARRADPRHVPRWLRPRLSSEQVRALGLAHVVNLDALASRSAGEDILWQWVGGALTWSRISDVLQRTNPAAYREAAQAMALQLELCTTVIQRYRATGRIGLEAGEYDIARDACEWMDALAEVVDQPTASEAADWAEAQLGALSAQCCPIATST